MAVAEARCRDCGGLAVPLVVCPHPDADESPVVQGWTLDELVTGYAAAHARSREGGPACQCWGCSRRTLGKRADLVVEAYLDVCACGGWLSGGRCLLCADAVAALRIGR